MDDYYKVLAGLALQTWHGLSTDYKGYTLCLHGFYDEGYNMQGHWISTSRFGDIKPLWEVIKEIENDDRKENS